MKKIPVKFEEVDAEGLLALLGKRVTLFCSNYIYTGDLLGVNDTCVLLGKDVFIVYETGDFSSSQWKDAQKIAKEWYVQTGAIESFGLSK